jgi:photosystem II stability/assembly factor-like uncharacterized protein
MGAQMKRFYNLVIIVIIALMSNAKGQWVGVSGPCGNVDVIITKGDTVICADEHGIYRSYDEGTNWITINNGLQLENIKALAFMGDSLLAVSSPNDNIYISGDYGKTWTLLNSLQNLNQSLSIWSLASKDSNIYVGTSRGLFISTDKGISWGQSDSTISNTLVLAIFFYKNSIFIGTQGYGIFQSTDNGFSWHEANNGLNSGNINVYSFCAIDTNIFAGTPGGVYKTTDEGTNWNRINTDSSYNYPYSSREYIAAKGQELFAASIYSLHGVLVSSDNGKNWKLADSNMAPYTNISSLAASNNYILAGSYYGICRTKLDSIKWNFTSAGSEIMSFGGKEISSGNPYIYAGTLLKGVFLSRDNGNTWTNIGLNDHAIYSFLFKDSNLFAAAGFNTVNNPLAGGIFVSTNDGTSWTEVDKNLNDGFFNYYVNALSTDGNNILAGTQWGLYKSTNNGIDWNAAGLANKFIKQIFVASSYIIATTMDSVYRSTDDGQNWTNISNGLPNGSIYSLAEVSNASYSGSYKLFLGTQHGVYSSTNGGLSWEASGLDSCSVFCMTESGGNLFAGTDYSHGRVFASTDEGKSWAQIAANLNNQDVIRIYSIGNYIYVSLGYYGGVWRRPLSEVVTATEQRNNLVVHFYLQQNYPNPFNPTTTINYSIPKESLVTIKVYDLLGREIKTLVNEDRPAGKYSVNFNANNLSSGIYLYTIKAGSFVQTKKMVLLK